jgi:hypothetical protein
MSFIAKLFFPKSPAMPVMKLPKVEDTPSYEDENRKRQAEEDERRRALNRKGRRSTILTTDSGLNEVDEENIEYKTLIGD